MNRRAFTVASAGAASASLASAAGPKRAILEMGLYRLRNSADGQTQRVTDFLRETLLPALRRAGTGPVGCFRNLMGGPEGPFILWITSYPGWAAIGTVEDKLAADKQFVKGLEVFGTRPGLNFVRFENTLLRGFETMPDIVPPPSGEGRAARVFEIRTYESNSSVTLHRKMKMFDDGEIGIFRRLGMNPVFFGETVVGRNRPNLTYMLAFDDLGHREKAWRAFASDPEWQKMRLLPGLSDAEVVSNIHNYMVSPLPFSQIR